VVAFVGSLLLTALMTYLVLWYAKRRPVGEPLTWGQAMAAGTFVFFFMFWVYGVVPHQWLTWAENELKFRSDAYLVGPSATTFKDFPINISKQKISDSIAALLYVIFLGGQITLFSIWQNRGDAAERKRKALEERTTAYGRPLAKKA
jgi:hypothetical protein